MDILLMIAYLTIVLSVLVVIHEGGHYLASRAFGVRVTEFMIGMPGPNIGVTIGGTKFGVTPILLGGYARVCGMEAGPEMPRLKEVLEYAYTHGTVLADQMALDLDMSVDEAIDTLYELAEWGCVNPPARKDQHNVFRTRPLKDKKRGLDLAEGTPREFHSAEELYQTERSQMYRSLPFWKRSVILLAGILVNLLFAVAMIVLIYSVIGVDVTLADGTVTHVTLNVATALQAGFGYIFEVAKAILGLFNPQTAAETVSNSTSVVGIAVMSKEYAEAGILMFMLFMAMISVSLGLMNLLPIPPLDGGRFVVEIFQKITGIQVGQRAMNVMSAVGMALFVLFFLVMLNQDINRFVFGNW